MSTVLRSGTGNHNCKLAARAVTEGGTYLARRSAKDLFVDLGQLPGHGEAPLRQGLLDQSQRLADSIRRFKGDGGPLVVAQHLEQAAHLARLAGQVADEGEAGSGVAGYRKCSR